MSLKEPINTLGGSCSRCDLPRKLFSVQFEFTQNPAVAWIDLHNLDLSAGAPVMMFDLKADILATGEVSGRFNPAKEINWLPGGAVLNPGT